jgi:hypothetical protein
MTTNPRTNVTPTKNEVTTKITSSPTKRVEARDQSPRTVESPSREDVRTSVKMHNPPGGKSSITFG